MVVGRTIVSGGGSQGGGKEGTRWGDSPMSPVCEGREASLPPLPSSSGAFISLRHIYNELAEVHVQNKGTGTTTCGTDKK